MSARWLRTGPLDRRLGSRDCSELGHSQDSRTPETASCGPAPPAAPRKPPHRRVRRVAMQPRRLTYEDDPQPQQQPASQRGADSGVQVASHSASLGHLTLSFRAGDADKENRPANLVDTHEDVIPNSQVDKIEQPGNLRYKLNQWISGMNKDFFRSFQQK